MNNYSLYDYVLRIGLSAAIGAFIGLEREWAQKEVGIRTFAILGLSGMVSTVAYPPYLTIVGAIFITIYAIIVSIHGIMQRGDAHLTTIVTLFITYLLGVLIGTNEILPAVIIAVLVTGILSFKAELHQIVGELTVEEMRAAVQFGILAFVVYPILPDRPVDPWGVINPRTIWLMVVLISGIGFINYVIMKKYGARGVAYTGFFGGLANSTAVVAEFIDRVKTQPSLATTFVSAALLAEVAMCLRNVLLCAFLSPSLLPALSIPFIAMMVAGLVSAYRYMTFEPVTVKIQSPFSIRNALMFGTIFLLMVLISAAASFYFGSTGFLISALLNGTISSASGTASAIALMGSGTISPRTAAIGIILNSISSIASKFILTYLSKNKIFFINYIVGASIMIAVGLVTTILVI